jgi:hypothetical protein
VELWSAHVSARLSNFCCRTHFVRRDVRVERSSDVTGCSQKWRKNLLKKRANGPFYDTKSPDYRDRHMRAKAWEGIGKELKIKRKFYVSSRDVRLACPRLKFPQETSNAKQLDPTAHFAMNGHVLILRRHAGTRGHRTSVHRRRCPTGNGQMLQHAASSHFWL